MDRIFDITADYSWLTNYKPKTSLTNYPLNSY